MNTLAGSNPLNDSGGNQDHPAHFLKISTHAESPIVLCRYRSGKLLREERQLNSSEYVAISHVWGNVQALEVNGVEGKIFLSVEKARFLKEKLPSILGEQYFWMDILCIDQGNDAARVTATRLIPSIFRQAKKTLVIRDSTGIRDCCVHTIGDVIKWEDDPLGWRSKMIQHYGWDHMEGKTAPFYEGVLERLWPLQEIMISECLQFVRCEDVPEHSSYKDDSLADINVGAHLVDSLANLANSWAQIYGVKKFSDDERTRSRFIHAFLNNGEVSRQRVPGQLPAISQNGYDYWFHMYSVRCTTKPRDFFFAIMPQYSWYAVPNQGKSMTFGQLFIDCIQQATRARIVLPPLIALGSQTSAAEVLTALPASENIPTPTCLGDFVKLLFGPILAESTSLGAMPFDSVAVEKIIGVKKMEEVLRLITSSVLQSEYRWVNASMGEIFNYGNEPDLDDFSQLPGNTLSHTLDDFGNSIKILYLMFRRFRTTTPYHSLRWGHAETWLLNRSKLAYVELLIRLAALINCGVGISAYSWSRSNVEPILVQFRGREVLALASISDVRCYETGLCEFRIVEAKFERFVLLAYYPRNEPRYNMGIFPSDIDFKFKKS